MAYGAFVQSIGVDSGTGTGASLAFQADLTSGNTIVVVMRFGGTPGAVTCTDSRGHSFVSIRQQAGTVPVYWWFVGSVTAGADIVTVTAANAVTMNWVIAEYEGGSTLGAENGGVGSSTAVSSGNFTSVQAVALIVGVGACDGQRTFTAGSLFTEREEVEQRVAIEDRVTSSAGSIAATMTLSSSDVWTGLGAVFYSTSGGGGVLYMVGVGGVVSPVGVCLRLANKVLPAVIGVGGGVVKQVRKVLGGGVGINAAIVVSYRRVVLLGGLLGFVGGLGSVYNVGTGIIEGLAMLMKRRRK